MKRLLLNFIAMLWFPVSIAGASLHYTPYLQQYGMYFSSDHITSAGFGSGMGISFCHWKNFLAQADVNVCWINGNAFATRLAAGYKKRGIWAPALLAQTSLLWGSHTEVLMEDGGRPAFPLPVIGLRLAAFRFESSQGFVSALEAGYGLGPYKGTCVELTFLSIGMKL
jgi:hypothetical protein